MPEADTLPKILVIDDELGPRESLRFLLKNEYRVVCADGVDRGLELLQEHKPDAVILDIRMPGRNGIEGLREIRRLDPDVAVIMLTGYGALGTAQEAVRNAANDYVEKPFDAAEMRRTVERQVAGTRRRRKRDQLVRELDQAKERLTAELREKEHLAELGEASAEFVHDLRNAFAVVCGSADLLRLQRDADPSAAAADQPPATDDSLAIMERTVFQCRDLLDAWQRLIHREPGLQHIFPVTAMVRETADSCQPAARAAQARLICDGEADQVEVLGDPIQLSRAVANLIHNAIQALPAADGCVRVTVARVDRQVHVRVADNGCGIPPEYLPRIFQPSVTTKAARGGMGLGLFIARKVVEAHGGNLTAASKVGQGTTMMITLPVYSEAAAESAAGVPRGA